MSAMYAFVQGLHDHGYVEAKNLVIEWGFANGNFEQLNILAADLVQRKVDVILGAGTFADDRHPMQTFAQAVIWRYATFPAHK